MCLLNEDVLHYQTTLNESFSCSAWICCFCTFIGPMACSGESTCSLDCIVKVWGAADEMCTFGSLVSERGAHGPLLPCLDLLNTANIWNVNPPENVSTPPNSFVLQVKRKSEVNATICSRTSGENTNTADWVGGPLTKMASWSPLYQEEAPGRLIEWSHTATHSGVTTENRKEVPSQLWACFSTVTQGLAERNGSC